MTVNPSSSRSRKARTRRSRASLTSSKRLIAAVALLAVFIAGAPFVFAQSKKKKKTATKPKTESKAQLQARKANLQAEIDLTDKLLKQTRRSKTLSLTQLAALNQKIQARESLISEINSEITMIDAQIADSSALVTQLDTEIAVLRRNYARMIVFAYRNQDSYHRMMFIFSSDHFNQAFLRLRYMQLISTNRKEEAKKIESRQQRMNENIRFLEQQKAEKKALLGSEETEKQQLAVEKEDKDKSFRELETKENDLKADLDKKRTEKANIDNAINKLIAEEIERNKPKPPPPPKGGGGTKPPAGGGSSTPAPTPAPTDGPLSASFLGSKGALPWPVAQGTVTGHFGKQPHPVLKGVFVNNNGIDIVTTADASARSVYDGEVTGVTNIPGSGWLVIVRHGEYLTVYAKLEEVFVKLGDKVKTKQNIGKVSKDADEGQSILHFEVWKSGTGKMDPEQWLLKK